MNRQKEKDWCHQKQKQQQQLASPHGLRWKTHHLLLNTITANERESPERESERVRESERERENGVRVQWGLNVTSCMT